MTDLAAALRTLCSRTLAGWRANPDLVEKDAREEQNLLSTGYYDRQIFELVQNAADAALRCSSATIELRLTATHLYASNTGEPLQEAGLRALILGGVSPKGGEEVGRFGLGFRSLLRLGGAVDMFSAGIGFRFDPPWCEEEGRKAAQLPDGADAPGMRLAKPLDPDQERDGDPVLREMLAWADTVIRAEIADENAQLAMLKELDAFPAEFLLFPKADLTVSLRRPDGIARKLRRSRQGALMVLHDGETEQPWHLFVQRFPVTDAAARLDAGKLQARDEVTISWAVPAAGGDRRAGQFWNAFPTRTPSVVPGILDARWKLNSDRSSLTGDAWNPALMRCAAKLIAESLPRLATQDDPGRPIDALPRQLDRKDDPAAPLHDAVWAEAERAAFIAAGGGALKLPSDLLRPPTDHSDLQATWCAIATEEVRDRLVHHTCLSTRDRASRLTHLASVLDRSDGDDEEDAAESENDDDAKPKARLSRSSESDWLTQVANAAPVIGRDVILLAGRLAAVAPRATYMLRNLAIVPTQDGRLAPAGKVVFPGSDMLATGLLVVHTDLAGDEAVRDVLTKVFQVQAMDDEAWLRALDIAWPQWGNPSSYEEGWDLLRSTPDAVRLRFMNEKRSRLRFKTRDGRWNAVDDVLLVGRIVSEAAATAHAGIVVDADFARVNGSLLAAIGVEDVPPDRWITEVQPACLSDPQDAATREYRRRQDAWSAQRDTLGYVGTVERLSGIGLVARLKAASRARLTKTLLSRLSQRAPTNTQVGGRGSRATQDRYPPIQVPNPSAWLLWKHGTVQIGTHLVSLAACSEVRRNLEPQEVEALTNWLPDDAALYAHWVPDWPGFTGPIEPVWNALLASRHTRAYAQLMPIWAAAARRGFVPTQVPNPNGVGDAPLSTFLVAVDASDFELGIKAQRPCILLDRATAAVWIKHGAGNIEQEIVTRAIGPAESPMRAIDYIPGIDEFLNGDGPAICLVESIERVLGTAATPAALLVDGEQIAVSRAWLRTTSSTAVLRRLLEAIGTVSKFNQSIDAVFAALDLSEIERRRARVRAEPDLASRLLRAVGHADILKDCLPAAASRVLTPDTSNYTLATLCLDIHGPAALREVQEALEQEGLRPPRRWGADEAQQFVLALGFPLAYAVAANPRPPSEIQVVGPRPLPPLHDYQEAALAELRGLIDSGEGRRRSILSLPTGAGKTRVAVEAAVRSLLRGETGRPFVLWVAQTEELAEQAVEAFRHVWAVEGVEETELRIIRFWGGQRTPPEADATQPTVVVALVQTLDGRLGLEDAAWLANAGMVIIDESHHAIAPTYTSLLNRVGVATGARQQARTKTEKREPVLLGLSATPFRSSGEDESRRLAARFEASVVPKDQEGLYSKLREGGILSRVAMEPLRIEQVFQLTEDEHARVQQFGELPDSALSRLSALTPRNDAILSAVESAKEESILLFANSVDHSTELAARLSLRGIRTRVVSGQTDRSARRDAVAAFKRREVRVVCNAVVFATGFDAPGVEMVLIARPVFSPVRFMQMVGRGLRGPRNGGTERCRVVTVQDNIEGYADRDPLAWWRGYYE